MVRKTAAAFAVAIIAASGAFAAHAAEADAAKTDASKTDASRAQMMKNAGDRITKSFDRLDVNHDGVLDKSEVQAPLDKAFRRFDKNGDGAIDAAEMKTMRDRWEKSGRKAPPGGDRFERADANHDGKVTREEFMATTPSWFERADADKDGKVTKAELDSFMEKRAKRMERAAGKKGEDAAKPQDHKADAQPAAAPGAAPGAAAGEKPGDKAADDDDDMDGGGAAGKDEGEPKK